MTSISLSGAYAEPEDGFHRVRFGHRKDRRPDLGQVQTGLAVTASSTPTSIVPASPKRPELDTVFKNSATEGTLAAPLQLGAVTDDA